MLAEALRSGDRTKLPGRRHEGWRWTDLFGALPTVPPLNLERQALGSWSAPIALDGVVVRRFAAPIQGGVEHVTLEVPAGDHRVVLDLIEAGQGRYVRDLAFDFTLGVGASVERLVMIADDADAVSLATTHVQMQARCDFAQTVLASGARRQRVETHVDHPGGEGRVRLDGAYLLAGARHADQTTVVRHLGRDGESRQLVRGVVAGSARGVFQGRIEVLQGADGTDARLAHNGLILSDRAEIDSKPELEIYADDVACAHGNTIGALDEDALFYAMSRGLPEAEARRLLITAFVEEVAERIGHPGLRDQALTFLAAQAEAFDGEGR